MGGGDLNLKKSWHPHTMKNQEKVWKAEQAKGEEERKLKDLRREIEDEKNREELKRIGENSGVLAKSDGDKKLEWMYKNSTELINREEYLLGRTVDKSFETLQAEEQRKDKNMLGVKQPINHVEHECIPFSIRAYRNIDSTEQVDLQRKVLEDPLMLIKEREMENRRKLLENPVKLKELHRILKTDEMLKEKKKSKKSKKSKKASKKRKKRSRSSSSSNTDTDSDAERNTDIDKELAKRYKKLKGALESMSGLNLRKYETISKELDKAAKSKKRSKHARGQRSSSSSSNNSSISGSDSSNERNYTTNRRSRHDSSPINSRRAAYRDERERRMSPKRMYSQRRDRSRSPRRDTFPQRRRTPSRSIDRNYSRRRSKSRSPLGRRDRDDQSKVERVKGGPSASKKLTEEEKEARRREMMENAAWREEDRTKTVQKHREAYTREEEQSKARDFDKEFINKQVRKAIANQTSVGSRIRSNLNNIQRSSRAMDSNFAKK